MNAQPMIVAIKRTHAMADAPVPPASQQMRRSHRRPNTTALLQTEQAARDRTP
jgi:hypothetical protein